MSVCRWGDKAGPPHASAKVRVRDWGTTKEGRVGKRGNVPIRAQPSAAAREPRCGGFNEEDRPGETKWRTWTEETEMQRKNKSQ